MVSRMLHRYDPCNTTVYHISRYLVTLVYHVTGQQYCHIHFPKETRRIRDDIDRILDDKKHIIPKLVDGIFDCR